MGLFLVLLIRIFVDKLFDECFDLVNGLHEQIFVAYVQDDEYDDEYNAQYDDHDNRELNKHGVSLQFGVFRMSTMVSVIVRFASLMGLASFMSSSCFAFNGCVTGLGSDFVTGCGCYYMICQT